MSHPPQDPRRPAGSDDEPETSWLSSSLPDEAEPPAAARGGPTPPGAPGAPPQAGPQTWQAGPAQQTGPAPTPAGYLSGYQQPPWSGSGAPLSEPAYQTGAPAPAPKKSPTGRIFAAVLAVLVIGAGIAVWQLWPEPTTTSRPTCWNPDITGDCPQFAGRDAALYVFGLKDEADAAGCKQLTVAEFEKGGGAPEGAVDIHRCRLDDLGASAFIVQWPSPAAAADAWMLLPESDGLPWYAFEERWTVDGQEMGDLLVGPESVASNDFHAQCYDDLPFCLWTLGVTGKGGTGEEGDWTLVQGKFDPLNAQEVEALNTFLADNPSTAAPRSTASPRPTSTTTSSRYEITDLNNVERSVQGHLAKGYCFNGKPDLTDALNTPTVVETVACTDPHLSQVVGFVDISDIGSRDDTDSHSKYAQRCQDLMSAENVPEGLQDPEQYYYPNPPEVEAGVRVVMCLVHTETPWTGSALDSTAAGY